MAVNLRKNIAINRNQTIDNENNPTKNGSDHQKKMTGTIFSYSRLVMSQPLSSFNTCIRWNTF